jgi:hypothetical protein
MQAALGRAAYALGDDDEAARAYGEANRLVDDFIGTLAPERVVLLETAAAVKAIRMARG